MYLICPTLLARAALPIRSAALVAAPPLCTCRGIAVFEEWGIVCTGHANGEIWAFLRPAGNDGSAGPQFPMGVDKGQGASASFGEYR